MFQINKFGESPHNFPPDSAETALINNELSEEKVSSSHATFFLFGGFPLQQPQLSMNPPTCFTPTVFTLLITDFFLKPNALMYINQKLASVLCK